MKKDMPLLRPFQEYKNTSLLSRYRVIDKELNQLKTDKLEPASFFSMLSSHDKKPYSPFRHPQGKVPGQTLGTAFFDISTGLFCFFKGNPCVAVKNNHYVTMGF